MRHSGERKLGVSVQNAILSARGSQQHAVINRGKEKQGFLSLPLLGCQVTSVAMVACIAGQSPSAIWLT